VYLKDSGYGVTRDSLKFWNEHKNSIGKITHMVVSEKELFSEHITENGVTYLVDYNCMIFGTNGAIILSGCNCGYGGEGPNGTAKILAELGLPIEKARQAMLENTIYYDAWTCEVR